MPDVAQPGRKYDTSSFFPRRHPRRIQLLIEIAMCRLAYQGELSVSVEMLLQEATKLLPGVTREQITRSLKRLGSFDPWVLVCKTGDPGRWSVVEEALPLYPIGYPSLFKDIFDELLVKYPLPPGATGLMGDGLNQLKAKHLCQQLGIREKMTPVCSNGGRRTCNPSDPLEIQCGRCKSKMAVNLTKYGSDCT